MKKFFHRLTAPVLALTVAIMLAGCTDSGSRNDVGIEAAEGILTEYLKVKGFGGDDFLSEGEAMDIDGESVYVFSWRIVENEHSDRLFGTYAVSADGNSFYEYQTERNEWIKDTWNTD